MIEEQAPDPADVAARNAKRAARLALVAVAVSLAVLAIDHTIKRAIVTEAQKAHALLDEVKRIAEEVRGERPPGPRQGTGANGAARHGGDDVVHDAPAGTVLDTPGPAAKAPRGKHPAGTKRGTAGNDRRTAGG